MVTTVLRKYSDFFDFWSYIYQTQHVWLRHLYIPLIKRQSPSFDSILGGANLPERTCTIGNGQLSLPEFHWNKPETIEMHNLDQDLSIRIHGKPRRNRELLSAP